MNKQAGGIVKGSRGDYIPIIGIESIVSKEQHLKLIDEITITNFKNISNLAKEICKQDDGFEELDITKVRNILRIISDLAMTSDALTIVSSNGIRRLNVKFKKLIKAIE